MLLNMITYNSNNIGLLGVLFVIQSKAAMRQNVGKELAFPLNFKRNSISKPFFLDFNEDDNYVQKNLESEDEEINYSLLLEGGGFLVIILLTILVDRLLTYRY